MGLRTNLLRWIAPSIPRAEDARKDSQESKDTGASLPRSLRRQFRVTRHICNGASGDVWLCVDRRRGTKVACKVVAHRTEDERRRRLLDTEMVVTKVLSQSGHRGIVKAHSVHRAADRTVLVMEYCELGDLFDFIRNMGRLSESLARGLFTQVAEALRFCHSQGIMHRDVKAENVLLTSSEATPWLPTAKLADFGLCAVVEGAAGTVTDAVGTRFWAAPEVIQGKEYGFEADVWSLGVLLLCMLTGKLPKQPKEGERPSPLWQSFLRGGVRFDLVRWGDVPVEAQHLVRGMLAPCPEDRLGLDAALAHPWVTGESPLGTSSGRELLVEKTAHLHIDVDRTESASTEDILQGGSATSSPSIACTPQFHIGVESMDTAAW